MNAQEIFVEAARVLYKDYDLYKKERKNKPEQSGTKLTNQKVEKKQKKKNGCC